MQETSRKPNVLFSHKHTLYSYSNISQLHNIMHVQINMNFTQNMLTWTVKNCLKMLSKCIVKPQIHVKFSFHHLLIAMNSLKKNMYIAVKKS